MPSQYYLLLLSAFFLPFNDAIPTPNRHSYFCPLTNSNSKTLICGPRPSLFTHPSTSRRSCSSTTTTKACSHDLSSHFRVKLVYRAPLDGKNAMNLQHLQTGPELMGVGSSSQDELDIIPITSSASSMNTTTVLPFAFDPEITLELLHISYTQLLESHHEFNPKHPSSNQLVNSDKFYASASFKTLLSYAEFWQKQDDALLTSFVANPLAAYYEPFLVRNGTQEIMRQLYQSIRKKLGSGVSGTSYLARITPQRQQLLSTPSNTIQDVVVKTLKLTDGYAETQNYFKSFPKELEASIRTSWLSRLGIVDYYPETYGIYFYAKESRATPIADKMRSAFSSMDGSFDEDDIESPQQPPGTVQKLRQSIFQALGPREQKEKDMFETLITDVDMDWIGMSETGSVSAFEKSCDARACGGKSNSKSQPIRRFKNGYNIDNEEEDGIQLDGLRRDEDAFAYQKAIRERHRHMNHPHRQQQLPSRQDASRLAKSLLVMGGFDERSIDEDVLLPVLKPNMRNPMATPFSTTESVEGSEAEETVDEEEGEDVTHEFGHRPVTPSNIGEWVEDETAILEQYSYQRHESRQKAAQGTTSNRKRSLYGNIEMEYIPMILHDFMSIDAIEVGYTLGDDCLFEYIVGEFASSRYAGIQITDRHAHNFGFKYVNFTSVYNIAGDFYVFPASESRPRPQLKRIDLGNFVKYRHGYEYDRLPVMMDKENHGISTNYRVPPPKEWSRTLLPVSPFDVHFKQRLTNPGKFDLVDKLFGRSDLSDGDLVNGLRGTFGEYRVGIEEVERLIERGEGSVKIYNIL